MKIKSYPSNSWKETSLGRITIHIHNLFEEHLKKHPLNDYREHNALLDVRNLVVQSVESFLNESAIKKKYGGFQIPWPQEYACQLKQSIKGRFP